MPFLSLLIYESLFLAPGNVAENVVLERESESTITFVEGARESYLGYLTLKVTWNTFL